MHKKGLKMEGKMNFVQLHLDVERQYQNGQVFSVKYYMDPLGSLGSVLLRRKSLLLQTGLLERAGLFLQTRLGRTSYLDKNYLNEQVYLDKYRIDEIYTLTQSQVFDQTILRSFIRCVKFHFYVGSSSNNFHYFSIFFTHLGGFFI